MNDLNWFDYVLIVWFILGPLILITQVGKERKPIDPGTAGWGFLIYLALIAGVLFA